MSTAAIGSANPSPITCGRKMRDHMRPQPPVPTWMKRCTVTASASRGEPLVRTEHAMARGALGGAMQVALAALAELAVQLEDRLEPEPGDLLEHLEEVVLAPDLGTHDVAGLDRVALVVDLDHRAA